MKADPQIGAAGGDEDAGEAEDGEAAHVAPRERAELVEARARRSSTDEEARGQDRAQGDEDIRREMGQGDLGEDRIGAPERGDEREDQVGRAFDRRRAPAYDSASRMADHVLEIAMLAAAAAPRCLRVLRRPAEPRALAPPRIRWRSPPPPLEAGAVLDFRVAILGRADHAGALIVREWDPPYRFVDVLVRGPVRAVGAPAPVRRGAGRTRRRTDAWEPGWRTALTYRFPGGPLGHVLDALGASARVEAAFAYRRRRLRALLG